MTVVQFWWQERSAAACLAVPDDASVMYMTEFIGSQALLLPPMSLKIDKVHLFTATRFGD